MGFDGPEQPRLGPPPTPAQGPQFSSSSVPPSWAELRPMLLAAWLLDGPFMQARYSFHPALFLDGLWTYAVALSPVLSLALSPFAPGWTPWVCLGLGSPLDSPGTVGGWCCMHPALPAMFRPCGAEPHCRRHCLY